MLLVHDSSTSVVAFDAISLLILVCVLFKVDSRGHYDDGDDEDDDCARSKNNNALIMRLRHFVSCTSDGQLSLLTTAVATCCDRWL